MIIPASDLENVTSIRTDTFIDTLSGIGGIPVGRITEVWGDASLGKSTVCLQAIKSAQERGLRCLFADAEWSYDALYATSLGVQNNKLDVLRQQFAEDLLDDILEAVDKEKYDLIVLDAVGSLLPRPEAEKGSGEKTIGGQAGLVAPFLRKVVPLLSLRNCALVVINHSFTDIMSGGIKSSGGKKLEFHKSLSIRLRPKQNAYLRQGDRVIGKVVYAKVTKNKVGPTENMEIDASILFGTGFSNELSVLDTALEKGIIVPEGRSYLFNGEKIATGAPKLREWAKANSDVLKELIGTT